MYIFSDIGGTKTRVAASKDLQSFTTEPIVFDSHDVFESQVQEIAAHAKQLAGEEPIQGMVMACKGSIDFSVGRLLRVPGKDGWNDQPLAQRLEELCGVRPTILNDMDAVGLGEAHYGAGKGSKIFVYVTVSTGVGGARIVEGKLDVAHVGSEPGHQIIDMSGAECPRCNEVSKIGSGRLEQYIGGAAFEQRTGQKPYDVTDPNVWDEMARRLAVGVHNMVVIWSPDTIALGGAMIEGIKGPTGISVEATEKYLKELLWIFPNAPVIKKAGLGDFGGLYGAMAYIKQQTPQDLHTPTNIESPSLTR